MSCYTKADIQCCGASKHIEHKDGHAAGLAEGNDKLLITFKFRSVLDIGLLKVNENFGTLSQLGDPASC